MFEKEDRVGGRSLTVDAYGSPADPLELGASMFVTMNRILYNVTQEFGLPLKEPYGFDDDMAIWDGDRFVYYQEKNTSTWWNWFKIYWKYGRSPSRFRTLVQSTSATLLKMYKAPYFPFRSLTTTSFMLGLNKFTSVSGDQVLSENGVRFTLPSMLDDDEMR
jgi:prenylcysteine oxidase/farnesylcysteine lyase